MELNVGQRLALNIDMHIILDAGAGTGKTQCTVNRIIEHYLAIDQRATRMLPPGPRPQALPSGALRVGLAEREDLSNWQGLLPSEVVVLTFTNRAAEEMRHRLWLELDRLQTGPTSDDGGSVRRDTRVTAPGLPEQLKAMLEDAPIGTIDSFLTRLIAPWKVTLMDRPTDEVVSESRRLVLISESLDVIWRLRSTGDAIDAGIPGEMAEGFLASRERLIQRFADRRTVHTVLASLLNQQIFVDDVGRRMDAAGGVNGDSIRQLILEIIEELAGEVAELCVELRELHLEWLDSVRNAATDLEISTALSEGMNRYAALDSLLQMTLPDTIWDQLLWIRALAVTTLPKSVLSKPSLSAFGMGNLTGSTDWPRGIETLGKIKDAATKADVTSTCREISSSIGQLWSSAIGRKSRKLATLVSLLDDSTLPVPCRPANHPSVWQPVTIPAPHHPPVGTLSLNIAGEAEAMSDLICVHRGLVEVFRELKINEGVHEFGDISDLAEDLLLTRCPRIMRSRYPVSVVGALDGISQSNPWRDDHIENALSILDSLQSAGEPAQGLSVEEISTLHQDLVERWARLKQIRARYRAFIIDEAQDNSSQQWRLLYRLWGERELSDTRPCPDTSWQPTVCCVGDRKQSIYAFRQARVSGFVEFGKSLRAINQHEFACVPELTRNPELRRVVEARDPRYGADGSFVTASEITASRGIVENSWVRFDVAEDDSTLPADVTRARSEGHVELVVNYRSAGNLLESMNDWWVGLFDDSHDGLPGDWYARSQSLVPFRSEACGRLEWLLPATKTAPGHPEENLNVALEPFHSGTLQQRENALIAARIQALIDGRETKVIGEGGKTWLDVEPLPAIPPEEIMVLLPSRGALADLNQRLQSLGIPAQSDREGGLLKRPTVKAMLGLVMFAARPNSRNFAAELARSPLVGMSDNEIQKFLGTARRGEDLFGRLIANAPTDGIGVLAERWQQHARRGRILEMLEETLDHSDLLLTYPRLSDRQEAEQFISLINSILREVGGDSIVLAQRLATLIEIASDKLDTENTPPPGAVRLMTIHGAKGCQARVVFVAGMFRASHGNVSQEVRKRVLATTELFVANSRPWLTRDSLKSGLWDMAQMVQEAQAQAEARRLLYVACTRVEDVLILCGAPSDAILSDGRIDFDMTDAQTKVFGEMWLDALRQGSGRAQDSSSQWLVEGDGKLIDNMPGAPSDDRPLPEAEDSERSIVPADLFVNSDLAAGTITSLPIHHHTDCFPTGQTIQSPLIKMNNLDATARIAFGNPPAAAQPATARKRIIRLSPHRLDSAYQCMRRFWLQSHVGLPSEAILLPIATNRAGGGDEPRLPSPKDIGSMFHRILELGLANPGPPGGSSPLAPLSSVWTEVSEDRLSKSDELDALIDEVFAEMLEAEADESCTRELMYAMTGAVCAGPLGVLTRGNPWQGETVEGLRTEWPFSLNHDVKDLGLQEQAWSVSGAQVTALVDEVRFLVTGIADLVLATRTESGGAALRAVDLKTTEAAGLLRKGKPAGDSLLAIPSDESEYSIAEKKILSEYRMQLAIYTLVLSRQEDARKAAGLPHREVLPPGILIAATGRLVTMTTEEISQALSDLNSLLTRIAHVSVESKSDVEQFPRKSDADDPACQHCPYFLGDIRICGPEGATLGAQ